MMPMHTFGPCYAQFGRVLDPKCITWICDKAQNLHDRTQSVRGQGAALRCVWASPGAPLTNKRAVREKEEASNAFVLPTITTLCTVIILGVKKPLIMLVGQAF